MLQEHDTDSSTSEDSIGQYGGILSNIRQDENRMGMAAALIASQGTLDGFVEKLTHKIASSKAAPQPCLIKYCQNISR